MKKRYLLLTLTLSFFGVINTGAQNWVQIGSDIDGEMLNNRSGWSVSLSSDGSVVAIGAPRHSDIVENAGHVRIYKNVSGTWTQIGSNIDGEKSDFSGHSISLNSDGSIVAIGAYGNDAGHVRIYKNINGMWTRIGLDIDGEALGDLCGWSVSLSSDGGIVAIGAPQNNGKANDAGHVRIYKNVSGTWTQIGSDIDGEAAGDNSGWSVSLSRDGSIVAIGGYFNDGNGNDAGHVRIYKNINGTWKQQGSDIDGELAGDLSGHSVSLNSDGSIVAIGTFSARGPVKIFTTNTTSVYSFQNNQPIQIHPNPAKEMITISVDPKYVGVSFAVVSNTGDKMFDGKIEKVDTSINITGLAEGLYFIQMGNQIQQSYKIMKQ